MGIDSDVFELISRTKNPEEAKQVEEQFARNAQRAEAFKAELDELNAAYDRFVSQFGPINKTTFGQTAAGGVIRRMPNIVKFREYPDAMLVCSLEVLAIERAIDRLFAFGGATDRADVAVDTGAMPLRLADSADGAIHSLSIGSSA